MILYCIPWYAKPNNQKAHIYTRTCTIINNYIVQTNTQTHKHILYTNKSNKLISSLYIYCLLIVLLL